jgi:ABC-type transporter MlaC component
MRTVTVIPVGCTYIRKGDKPINVTVTARNSDGSYQVRDNNTGVVTRFTPYRG